MRVKLFFYFLGSLILFTGLLWMMLPHAYHNKITIQKNHLLHIIQGIIISVIGIITIIITRKN